MNARAMWSQHRSRTDDRHASADKSDTGANVGASPPGSGAAADGLDLAAVDPEKGIVIREPERGETGYWAGAPGVYRDEETSIFYLAYRHRRPIGVSDERGYLSVIAEGTDGIHFENIWTVHKSEVETASMERSCLRRLGDRWALYLCFVDPVDNHWRIDVITADTPRNFDVADRQPALTAENTFSAGIKDPWMMHINGAWCMFAAYAAATAQTREHHVEAHATGDIYATGITTAPTGLATSLDGIHFDWHGQALATGRSWDAYQSRLTTILASPRGFVALYDGAANKDENYEERSGLAMSFNLTDWIRLTPNGPLYSSPHRTGSMRYVDAITVGDETLLYYEYARPDGAHDLRVSTVPKRKQR